MCIYRYPLTNEQEATLASIYTDPLVPNLPWTRVLELLRSVNKVQVVREMNGKIQIIWLDSDHTRCIHFLNRLHERHVNGSQVRQIREFLEDRLKINQGEDCDQC
ncbi:hypothetical protein [Phormidesmis sp. 146-33]